MRTSSPENSECTEADMNLYREVLDHIPTAAIVVDNQMRVRYTNRAFRE